MSDGSQLPVGVVGAGPVGLIAALGLAHHRIPVVLFEEDAQLSLDTKAGTVLTRTLEVLHRYGALTPVLRASLRIDEIGDIDRESNTPRSSLFTSELREDTRFPFMINIPQNELEPVLSDALAERAPGALRLGCRVEGFSQHEDRVEVEVDTDGRRELVQVSHLLGCDGGRSHVRALLGVKVQGRTIAERMMLVDVRADLDVQHPRDYPYLAYFGDPSEWMILVRQPHCWRFLFPLGPDAPEPTQAELGEKARRFIGEVSDLEVIGMNAYTVHQRVAESWREERVFLLGDAAHLITPMWALGLNTGVLDASNLPWRLAWVLRGWATPQLLDGYEREQAPVAIKGSGEMAEAARAHMSRMADAADVMEYGDWGNVFTRAPLGVSLDTEGSGDWSMVRYGQAPDAVRVGDRAPDLPLFGADGIVHVHDLAADAFVALYFTDTRRSPRIPAQGSTALRHFVVSRWDAPHDSGLRDRALFDPGDRVRRRFGIEGDAVVLLRPDAHVASIEAYEQGRGVELTLASYERITGRPPASCAPTA
ncbi:MAG: FAD-dependent monooxygenase [Solirubrobacteraceae bacterium]